MPQDGGRTAPTIDSQLGGDDVPVSVLVVDDQKVFREVMRAVVDATPGMRLAGEAASGQAALLAVEDCNPQFVLIDVRMDGMDGVALARLLLARAEPPVVLLASVQQPPASLPTLPDGRPVDFVMKEGLRPAVLIEVWERAGGGAGRAR